MHRFTDKSRPGNYPFHCIPTDPPFHPLFYSLGSAPPQRLAPQAKTSAPACYERARTNSPSEPCEYVELCKRRTLPCVEKNGWSDSAVHRDPCSATLVDGIGRNRTRITPPWPTKRQMCRLNVVHRCQECAPHGLCCVRARGSKPRATEAPNARAAPLCSSLSTPQTVRLVCRTTRPDACTCQDLSTWRQTWTCSGIVT